MFAVKILLISTSILLLLPLTDSVASNNCGHVCGPPSVMCYFTNWAWYRQGIAKFLPSNINISLCTHLMYAFAKLNEVTLTLESGDSWADIDNHFYQQVTALNAYGLIVLLSIGGWEESHGNKYSRLVNNDTARRNFINHSIRFLHEYGFQGLDVDWEYPRCWQGDCTAGPHSDKHNFALFIQELKLAYKKENLLVSLAISASKRIIDEAYDISIISKYADHINVMNYDIHTASDGVTGPNSPFFSYDGSLSVIQTMEYLVSLGADRCKLVPGAPLYGRSFKLANPENHGFGALVTGPGRAGNYTGEAGFLAFYEICLRIKNEGWIVKHSIQNSSYAYKSDQFVSYCGLQDMYFRTAYTKNSMYKGMMIWALDEDDFNNVCGCGSYPLLTAINIGLGRLHWPFYKPQVCTIDL